MIVDTLMHKFERTNPPIFAHCALEQRQWQLRALQTTDAAQSLRVFQEGSPTSSAAAGHPTPQPGRPSSRTAEPRRADGTFPYSRPSHVS